MSERAKAAIITGFVLGWLAWCDDQACDPPSAPRPGLDNQLAIDAWRDGWLAAATCDTAGDRPQHSEAPRMCDVYLKVLRTMRVAPRIYTIKDLAPALVGGRTA